MDVCNPKKFVVVVVDPAQTEQCDDARLLAVRTALAQALATWEPQEITVGLVHTAAFNVALNLQDMQAVYLFVGYVACKAVVRQEQTVAVPRRLPCQSLGPNASVLLVSLVHTAASKDLNLRIKSNPNQIESKSNRIKILIEA